MVFTNEGAPRKAGLFALHDTKHFLQYFSRYLCGVGDAVVAADGLDSWTALAATSDIMAICAGTEMAMRRKSLR